jgi:hypothetical protein
MMRIFNRTNFLLIFLISGITFLSCSQQPDKPKNYKVEDSNKSDNASKVDSNLNQLDTSSIVVTSKDLVTEYSENEVAADSKYKGKTIIVEGQIIDIKKGVSGETFIVLEGIQGKPQVQCYYNGIDDIKTLKPGKMVFMQGVCDGLWVNVILNSCRRLGEFVK